jgi:two-component system, CitB family, sensor kinase
LTVSEGEQGGALFEVRLPLGTAVGHAGVTGRTGVRGDV